VAAQQRRAGNGAEHTQPARAERSMKKGRDLPQAMRRPTGPRHHRELTPHQSTLPLNMRQLRMQQLRIRAAGNMRADIQAKSINNRWRLDE
jgi:hypothetical protein